MGRHCSKGSRNCLVWSEGIFGCRLWLSEKIYTSVQNKICNPELHDIPPCPAQLPHNYACKYKGNMKGKTEQDNTEHEWQKHRKWMIFGRDNEMGPAAPLHLHLHQHSFHLYIHFFIIIQSPSTLHLHHSLSILKLPPQCLDVFRARHKETRSCGDQTLPGVWDFRFPIADLEISW